MNWYKEAFEGQNIADFLASVIHESFSKAADRLCAFGYLNQEERIRLSGIIGELLKEFGKMTKEIDGKNILIDKDDAKKIFGELKPFKNNGMV